ASSNTSNSWSFIVPNLGSSENGCAIVSIVKNPETTIVSKGYNNCPTGSSANIVERELKVTY
ncbi:MAG: hypothetical protein ABH951_02170, partial [Patescibacteria group bacterium]